jgi:flagellar protein FliO/FliZ
MFCIHSLLRKIGSIALLCVLSGASAVAQSVEQVGKSVGKFADPDKVTELPTSGIANMGQVTVALVIVLALIFAAAWGMRRFKVFHGSGQAALQVVQGINLGPKERAVLINVQGRKLLLGVAPGCVNLLLELPADANTDPSGEAAPITANVVTDNATPDFKTLLKRSMGLSR